MNLYENIISVIKESQIKLGYDSMPIGINYMNSSLCHLLDGEVNDEILSDFANSVKNTLGKVDFKSIENGYHLTVSAQGVDYVHSLIDDNDFLPQFISTIRRFDCTLDDVINVFKRYSDNVVVEEIDNGEFDYLIYFADGKPDTFWYCIDTEDLGMTYHRFTKDDYLDFNF